MHARRSPEIGPLLRVLHHHEVEFVISGSVAAQLHGVDLEPGDLDIVPAPTADNVERLIAALTELEAHPAGPFGAWTTDERGESKWIARETSPEELAAWRPDPGDLESLDHLMTTRFGDLDIVPRVTGRFQELRADAVAMTAHDVPVFVAHIDDVLLRLTVPRREKDIPRVAALRDIQRGNRRGR